VAEGARLETNPVMPILLGITLVISNYRGREY